MNIGSQVKEHRNELGLSLRELGELAGVTASFLSQVENDQVSPSLISLQKIALALQVPMFSLLNDTPNGNVVRADQRRKIRFDDDKITYDLLTPDFSRDMMAYLITIEPDTCRIAQPLVKPTQQWMHVLKGKMKIIIGDEEHLLDEGDTVSFDGDLLQEFSAVGDQKLQTCRFLSYQVTYWYSLNVFRASC